MTKTLKLLITLMALALPTMAKAERIPFYVAVATWTLGGTGTNALAFQNTSSTRDVIILKINIAPISGGTVTSGPANFWVLPSTSMTHGGTSQVSALASNNGNWAAPSFVSFSTGPVVVTFEGPKASYGLPYTVIGVNPDETASPIQNVIDNGFEANAEDSGIVLPKGANRGVIFQQKQFGATDWTAGVVLARITYILK